MNYRLVQWAAGHTDSEGMLQANKIYVGWPFLLPRVGLGKERVEYTTPL